MMMSLSAKPSSSYSFPSKSSSLRVSTISNGGSCRFLPQSFDCTGNSLVTEIRRGTTRKIHFATVPTQRTSSFHTNVSPEKRDFGVQVTMVDPLEAKRLASKQMAEIRATESLKRRRQIEAINGGWAMIGLTAGLVIEGQTGKGILSQMAGYLEPIFYLIHTLNIPLDLPGLTSARDVM